MSGRMVVTGAGGFIGYHLANALAADGQHVVGVDLHFPDADGVFGPPRFTPVLGDFRDAALMRDTLVGAKVLFHLAGVHLQVSVPDSVYWDVNVHSLQPLFRLALDAGVSRCVHVSSVGVYGDVGSNAATEATVPHPQSIYGETKLAGEQAVLEFGRQQGFEVVVLRPAWAYGPGCPRTAKLCRALARRRFFMIGAGHNLRHPLYIDDLIDAFRLAAKTPAVAGDVFVIAGERAVTTRELIEAFCTVFGYHFPRVRVPYGVGASLALAVEGLCKLIGTEPPISRRTLEFFNTSNNFDTSHAGAVLGFTPRYPLYAGLTATRDRMDAAHVRDAIEGTTLPNV